MSDLINNVYLPDFKKRSIREGDAYKLLSENKKDTSVLEGYENHPDAGVVNFESFDKFLGEGGTKEEWIARHATPEVQKEFFSNVGDFMLETGKDTALSLATAVINGADVATNLMPLFVKAFDKAPLATGMPEGFLNEATEKQVYDFANNISNNLGEAREYLNEFKKDDNFVSQFVGVMSQDLLYSIPIYNKLRSAGMPKYPAFFISGGIGGAIGIEKEVMGARSTFSQEIFAKDIIELKNLVGILPDTPEDKIADEVIQALEYGAFSTAIPGIIDSFKFMKRYIPAMAGTTGAVVGMTADNEAEGSPIKAIVNAVNKVPIFKSAVRDAAEKKITKGNADQIYNTIKNTPGVKEAELKWLDLEDNLKARSQMKKAPLTKDEVLELIDGNKVDVSEVSFGGSASRLSDDLEQKILDFEQKVEKAARAQDLGYADINYDVYPYARRLAGNTNIDKVRKETSMDFSQLNDLLLGLPLNSKTFLKDYAGKKGQIEIHKFTDNLNNRPVYVGRELAEELINEKEVVRDIPAALNSPGTPRYTRNRVLEFEPLEIEKFLIEREKRIFMKDNTSPKFERYTEPGGDDYTELVFKVKKGGMDIGIPTTRYDDKISYTPYKNPSHMDVKSEIAHVRFKTRMNGNMKLLAVEEMQSDFGIRTAKIKKADMEQIDELSGQQLGFMAGEAFPGNKFTVEEAQRKLKANVEGYDFPFKNNWYELTIKRLARYAADNGFDGIAIPKGDKAANRYGESITKAQKIGLQIVDGPKKGSYFFDLNYMNEAGNIVERGPSFNQSNYQEMEKIIGKKEFQNIQSQIEELINDQEEIGEFMLKDFNIPYKKDIILGSGAGKYRLYNETIPSYMKKYAKKWNAKVYDDNLFRSTASETGEEFKDLPVTVLELSDEMKTGVQSSSQPLFELLGGVSLATWGAQAVSDNIENNIISQKTN
jgi:hypothetical protein